MTQHPDLARLNRLENLSGRLDSAFRIPVIGYRVGWDAILGLLPGIGDVAAATPAAYIVLESYRMGLPRARLAQQIANVGVDTLIGSVPILGSLFDAVYKSNNRNVAILRSHVEQRVAAETGMHEAGSHRPPLDGRA